MMEAKPKAVVLLSGGLDSTTVLAIANASGYESYALSFSYGQRHSWELECARKIAANSGVKDHRIAQIDLRVFGGSALTADISVPKGRSVEEMSDKIPVTYVPARNTIFLSFALAWAEVLGSSDIFIGVNALDYSGYPDCRPKFIEAFERLANLATKAGVDPPESEDPYAPHLRCRMQRSCDPETRTRDGLWTDEQLLRSFPQPVNRAEAVIPACSRQKGFIENGLTDPAKYREAPTEVSS